ncbi:unnamed protein product [Microthlaspi erraticum]|uniref:non-specific serine/threonine protein kinase n=1 Tax=Microthlaspi erraticum TaxID=1685480 RepID=A0A6D2I6K3_9BRAS|nr:unnamed protein product [Microthlaspi erraticum]
MSAAATMPMPSNYDEISMQQSMLFSDSPKDLKNLRTQLYSAAEYFELSYTNDEQKHIVVETLKDYAIKALVNTVDHLGSVTYKVNDFVDEKVDEVAGTELRVSCIEQRLKMCQEYMDHEAGEIKKGGNLGKLKNFESSSFGEEDDWNQFRNAVRSTIRETPPPPVVSIFGKASKRAQIAPNGESLDREYKMSDKEKALALVYVEDFNESMEDCIREHPEDDTYIRLMRGYMHCVSNFYSEEDMIKYMKETHQAEKEDVGQVLKAVRSCEGGKVYLRYTSALRSTNKPTEDTMDIKTEKIKSSSQGKGKRGKGKPYVGSPEASVRSDEDTMGKIEQTDDRVKGKAEVGIEVSETPNLPEESIRSDVAMAEDTMGKIEQDVPTIEKILKSHADALMGCLTEGNEEMRCKQGEDILKVLTKELYAMFDGATESYKTLKKENGFASGGNKENEKKLLATLSGIGNSSIEGYRVGKLLVSNKEIAKGSNGTAVLEGFYEVLVAVKRLVRTDDDVAQKEILEISNAMASVRHENIVRWYGVEQDERFIYISLERCDCSLGDLIRQSSALLDNPTASSSTHSAQTNQILDDVKEVQLWKDTTLHPSPVLLKLMRDVVAGLAHLHDKGIEHRDLNPQNVLIVKASSLCAKLSISMGISKPVTGAGDLFSLGTDFFLIESLPEAVHLLSGLLHPDPDSRPGAQKVLLHPLFWNSHTRLSFLKDASDRLDIEKREESDLLAAVEGTSAAVTLKVNWDKKLDSIFLNDIVSYRPYRYDSIKELLRAIRNPMNHYIALSKEVKELIGSLPEGCDMYFSSKFPKLLIEVYQVLLSYCYDEDLFSKYFKTPA